MMLRYVHTNIVAKDAKKLVEFYKKVFDCRSIGETRDISGEWLDQMTGVKTSHITGEHICLPGYGELVKTEYSDGRKAVFVYAADPEGNIIEIQSWS